VVTALARLGLSRCHRRCRTWGWNCLRPRRPGRAGRARRGRARSSARLRRAEDPRPSRRHRANVRGHRLQVL